VKETELWSKLWLTTYAATPRFFYPKQKANAFVALFTFVFILVKSLLGNNLVFNQNAVFWLGF
jgi:hypothetical protein